jgi:hypothetical protein
MEIRRTRIVLGAALFALAAAGLAVWRQFDNDVTAAYARAMRGGVVVQTRCGPIEYAEAGQGVPLLMVHGSGGGHDQGIAFAGALAQQGVRVIAMSRFGYLRTPMRTRVCLMHSAFVELRSLARRRARCRRCRWRSAIPSG